MVEPNYSTAGIAVLADTLALNGATIRSAQTGGAADVSHPGLAHDPAHKVDWQQTRPSATGVSITSRPAEGDTYRRGETIRVAVEFSEAVDVAGTPRIAIDLDPADWGTKLAAYESGGGTATLTFAHAVERPNYSTAGVAVLADTLEANGGSIRAAAGGADAALGHAGLGHDPAHKVDWRPGLSVADARAAEGPGATLDFAVTLDAAAQETVTVDYATADGTAAAGEDYRSASGTLTFAAGERSKTVSVALLDDAHDEGEETLSLRLANAAGAYIADGEATGTVRNSDPMPRAWLARFGRTATMHALEAIGERIEGGPQASHLTVGGQRVDALFGGYRERFGAGGGDGDSGADAPDANLQPEPAWARMERMRLEFQGAAHGSPAGGSLAGGSPAGGRLAESSLAGGGFAGGGFAGGGTAYGNPAHGDMGVGGSWTSGLAGASMNTPGANTNLPGASPGRPGVNPGLPGNSPDPQYTGQPTAGLPSAGHSARSALKQALGLPALGNGLMGTSFFYSRPDNEAGGPAEGPGRFGDWSVWGRTAATRFSGTENALSIQGEVATATLGVDTEWNRWMTGLVLAMSEGDGTFSHTEAAGGTVSSTLASLYPFARYRINDRTQVWGTLGYGTGELWLAPDGVDVPIETALVTTAAAVGGRGVLAVRTGQAGAFELAIRSDAFATQTTSDRAENLMGATGAASRVRLMLEGTGAMPLSNGAVLKPSLEAGLRYDGGDAETGAGIEIGAGLGLAAGRFAVEADVRGLLAHEDAAYEEWGASASVRFQPRSDGLGLNASLGSAWGAANSGVQSLWSTETANGLARGGAFHAAQRMQAEFGYGFQGRKGRALWAPFVAADSGDGQDALRMGVKLTSGPHAEAALELGRRAGQDGLPEHAVQLGGRIRW